MLRKLAIDRFNKKYAFRRLMFCEKLYSEILFLPQSIHTCCHCTKVPYSPPLLFPQKTDKFKFNFYQYLKNLDEIMQANQSYNSVCGGCKFLKYREVPKFPLKENITFFTVNHFTKCNSDCVYCAIGRKTEDIKYKLLPIIQKMVKDKMINQSCLFNWGGGEPVICSEFEEIAGFLHEHNFRQAVNSSGIIFSSTILEGLKDNSMSIQISPDSGTEQTYIKIKRRNNFDKVWENIKKYAQYPDMLFVKYIFFSFSANETDVNEFINKCVRAGVKKIVIDCESNSANNPDSRFGGITEDIIRSAVLMKKLAQENNISYEISYQWKDEHKKLIETA